MFLEVYPQVLGISTHKRCSKCNELKHATLEYFRCDKRASDGLTSSCKTCDAAYRASVRETLREHKHEYYLANRDAIADRQRRYNADHREECSASKRRWAMENREHKAELDRNWRAANRERKAATTRRWYQANRERADATCGRWREANPDRVAQYGQRWQRANPENGRIRQHLRRARKAGNGGTYTPYDLAAIRAAQTDKRGRLICWRCGKPINDTPDLDHWIPLDKEGSNSAGNLHYMHVTCNRSKGAKHPTEIGRLL